MEDYRVKTSWRTSSKREYVFDKLGAVGVLAVMDLWSYCASEKTDGDLVGMSDKKIAAEAKWRGDPDEFMAALTDEDFQLVDGGPGERFIHDWKDHNPWVAGSNGRKAQASKGGKKSAEKRKAAKVNPTDSENSTTESQISSTDSGNSTTESKMSSTPSPSVSASLPFPNPTAPRRVAEPQKAHHEGMPTKDGKGWFITDRLMSTLCDTYPHDKVDVRQELLKANAWLIANPTKQKTHRGMPRFINGWMARAAKDAEKPKEKRDVTVGWCSPSTEFKNQDPSEMW